MDTDGHTSLLLVRHGQSIWNLEHRWQGQANPPLSDHGRLQARAAAGSIGTVDIIVSSTQIRALETATIISEQVGVGPVQSVEGLHERHAGEWSGLTTTEIEERWPGWIESARRPEGWETDAEVLTRVTAAMETVVATFRGATVLVISHGGVIVTVEDHLAVREGRIPNLHGRVVVDTSPGWMAGDRLQLIPPDITTGGGTGSRV
jgi:probable phosphoglycerate mutase